MLKKIILLFLLVPAIFLAGEAMVVATPKLIRVAILQNTDHFILGVDGRHTISDPVKGTKIAVGVRLRPALVKLDNGRIKIGDKTYEGERLLIEPREDATLRIDNKHFRGGITIIKKEGKALTVVNSVELEQYIRGVLYHEVSDKWPLEAIRAQAVATRTYALYSMEKFAARDFDVTNDIYSQVYGGKSAERYRTNLAVRRTRGDVLTYQGKIFPAFFHANSGGVTEDAKELWNIDIPPLAGGVESPFSVNSPHFRWKRNFRLKDIQDKLNAKGYGIGLIKEIVVVEKNKSGRVRKLRILDRDGNKMEINGKAFRDMIGPNILRSNKYDVQMQGWYVDFVGHGWGHGVGLDQWGAYNMALMRYPYKKILQFYYPGAEIGHYKDLE